MPRQILVGLLLLLVGIFSVQGQNAGTSQGKQEKIVKMKEVTYTEPTSGAQMYKNYCAACHGIDGKGDGPAADFLKVWPPDLTMLTQRNNAKYPADHVVATLRHGTSSHAHGTSDMPLWGSVFQTLDENRTVGEMRIHNLTVYIESLQRK